MSNPSKPSKSSPLPGDDRNVVAAGSAGTELTLEEQVHEFWKKNSRFIIFLVVLGFLVIVRREGVRYMWAARERGISEAYGKCSTPAELKAFAAENPKHVLAGIALLRVGDEDYNAREYLDAADAYTKAVEPLKDTPMAARAKIGAAISEVQGGDRAKGEAALKALADDMTIMAAERMEARYQLAVIAIADGRLDDARKALDEITQTPTAGMWAQRAYQLRATLGGGEEEVASTAPETTPAAGGTPEIKLNLPAATDSKP